MRIVHVSTSVSGGAGLAAFRLHTTMLKNNFNSVLYSQTYENPDLSCIKVEITRPKGIIERVTNYVYNKINNYQNQKYKRFNFEHYSNLRTLYRIDKHCKKDDIIILHWVADFLDYKSFFRNIDKDSKLFIYIHDFNTIQGKLHTLFDRKKIKGTNLERIENYYLSKKIAYYHQIKNLKIIANSDFSYRILIQSGFFLKDSLFKISLGLPKGELIANDKKSAKINLGFKEHDFLILICSNIIESELKGFDRIMKIFNTFKNHSNIKFIGLGKLSTEYLINHDNFFNYETWDPEFKSKIFSASDVTLSTSYEETFGQTIIESYSCSTPVIVYNNAALPELVSHFETGFIANNDNDVYDFINLLFTNVALKDKLTKNAREIFLKKYTSSIQLSKLQELLINNGKNRAC
jgi:glycosyltransferase involved in cell wall biosynthesis